MAARKPRKQTRKPSAKAVKAAADRAERRAKGLGMETSWESGDDLREVVAARPVGRPLDYKPEYAATARLLCRRGATRFDLSLEFGVHTATVATWAVKYEEFGTAMKDGRAAFDDSVERSLAERAIGYSYTSEKIFCTNGMVTRVVTTEHVPPDPGAAKIWLTNRRPKEWADTSKHEHTGAGGTALTMTDPLVLARFIGNCLSAGAGVIDILPDMKTIGAAE